MADDKDKKIGEVPHLDNVTGEEKIPVSANGQPRYVEVNQIREGLLTENQAKEDYQPKGKYQPEGDYLTQEEADKRYAGVNAIPDVSQFVTEQDVDEKLAKLPVGGVTWGRIVNTPKIHLVGSFRTSTASNCYIWINGEKYLQPQYFDFVLEGVSFEYGNVPMSSAFISPYAETLEKVKLSGIKDVKSAMNFSDIKTLDLSEFDITEDNTDFSELFRNFSNILSIGDISHWDTKNVQNMEQMFYGCKNLTQNIDLRGWDVGSLESVASMFQNCTLLTDVNLNGWDTQKLSDLSGPFYQCTSITDIDLGGWDVSNVETIYNCFYRCQKLTNLNLSGWKFNKLTNLSNAFVGCVLLTNLDLEGDNCPVTNMDGCFNGCAALETLNLSGWDTSNLTSISNNTFQNCSTLHTLKLSGWDLSNYNPTSATSFFLNYIPTLTTLIGPIYNISQTFSMGKCTQLSADSAMVIINGLKEGVSGLKVSFNPNTYSSLIPEQLAIGTSKGWTIASA